MWTRRAAGWDHSDVPGLESVARAVLDRAEPSAGLVVVDLGSGSGQLTLELARTAAVVKAVDFSPSMLELLQERAAGQHLGNIESTLATIQEVEFPPGSVDLIVTNYALHHLRDPEKQHFADRAARWLRPGGRMVIGDMMFGKGREARDRQIIASKIVSIGRRGPAGWWRLAKNGWRFLVIRQECPVSIAQWESILSTAGFGAIRSDAIVAEAAVMSAVLTP
jgi:ubiquinone/menaquinone biosynthesis C-methylase UbiE